MATTTATNADRPFAGPPSAATWSWRDSLLAAVMLPLLSALLLLSGQQLLTQLSRIPANSYYNTHQAAILSQENGMAYVQASAKRLQRIPPAHRGEQEWRRLATLLLALPLADDQAETAQQRETDIHTALSATLARNPAHPLSWALLSSVRMPPRHACVLGLAALRQSYRVAPIEPDAVAFRLEIAARCQLDQQSSLENSLRRDLLALIRHGGYTQRNALIAWAQKSPAARALIRELLRGQDDASARFERDLAGYAAKAKATESAFLDL